MSDTDDETPWSPDGPGAFEKITAQLSRKSSSRDTEIERPDPQAFIPGYRIRYIELENACAFLRGEGWAGGIGFDEAVKALRSQPASEPSLDVDDLDSILLALGQFPTWFPETTEKVRAIRALSQPADMSPTHDRDNEAATTPESR